jgi:hypothetical protein
VKREIDSRKGQAEVLHGSPDVEVLRVTRVVNE